MTTNIYVGFKTQQFPNNVVRIARICSGKPGFIYRKFWLIILLSGVLAHTAMASSIQYNPISGNTSLADKSAKQSSSDSGATDNIESAKLLKFEAGSDFTFDLRVSLRPDQYVDRNNSFMERSTPLMWNPHTLPENTMPSFDASLSTAATGKFYKSLKYGIRKGRRLSSSHGGLFSTLRLYLKLEY